LIKGPFTKFRENNSPDTRGDMGHIQNDLASLSPIQKGGRLTKNLQETVQLFNVTTLDINVIAEVEMLKLPAFFFSF
jgi:hypothetical protein